MQSHSLNPGQASAVNLKGTSSAEVMGLPAWMPDIRSVQQVEPAGGHCFFEASADYLNFESYVKAKGLQDWHLKATQIDMSCQLLRAILQKRYRSSMPELIRMANHAGENVAFMSALAESVSLFSWARSTARRYFGIVKKILRETCLCKGFIGSLRLHAQTNSYNRILGKKYGKLPPDDTRRVLLERWVQTIRQETRNSSDSSLRTIISFFLTQVLPQIGVDVEHWPSDAGARAEMMFKEDPLLFEKICGPPGETKSVVKATRLRLLLQDILRVNIIIPKSFSRAWAKKDPEEGNRDAGADTISPDDLDKLYESCSGNVKHELMFLLMITTGLRIGGVAQIRIKDVADVVEERFVARAHGRTREKGNKWASFLLTARVQTLVETWLHEHRPASSSAFIFPGLHDGHVTSDALRKVFNGLCAAAGLSGPQFHPHALRHSYAHMLLGAGNSVDVISKCLNHSNSAITEAVYLKENPVELLKRANIPWMDDCSDKSVSSSSLPAFLDAKSKQSTAPRAQNEVNAKRRKVDRRLHALDMFQPLCE